MIALIRMLRPEQWYKNLVAFLGLIFAQELLMPGAAGKAIAAFGLLCIYSGAGYVINDIADINRDALHPEKRHRPLPSGHVKIWQAALWAVLLFAGATYGSFALGSMFAAGALLFFATGMAYTFVLKHWYLVDVIAIGFTFTLRAILGVLAIDVFLSPWLVLCTFLVALLLALGKRKSEVLFLGRNASQHRDVLEHYKNQATDYLIVATLASLFISYCIYSIIARSNTYLLVTIPAAAFLLFRYTSYIFSGSSVARHTEQIFRDIPMMAGMLIWALLVFVVLYPVRV